MIERQTDRVRHVCLALPGAEERLSHGEPTFFVGKKVFAMFAGNHHNDGHIAVWLPVPPGEQVSLIEAAPEKYFRPPYVGVRGWVGIELPAIDEEELGFRLHTAWRLIAPKRLRDAAPVAGTGAPVQTARLELRPMTPAFLRASLAGRPAEAAGLLGAALPAEWPGAWAGVLRYRLRQLEAEPALQPWLLRAMVLRNEQAMAGHIGFHDAPGAASLADFAPTGVEIGYSVFPAHQRRGYAHEAATGLMNWAGHVHGVTSFVLSISPDNLPSQALAAKLGFVRIGVQIDDEDGVEEVWRCVTTP
jgi:RimJ/RimL family protein N-acetyltransferase